MNRIFLYVHTLRYLKWKQIVYRVYYLLKRHLLPAPGLSAPPSDADLPSHCGVSSPFLAAAPCYQRGVFTFLNLPKSFPEEVDWSFTGYGKLWTYHLNYFDYLNQPDMTADQGLRLIRSFLASKKRTRIGWEPYPISLRGINWIKFLSRWGSRDEAIHRGLYGQYRFLSGNLEYHLLGNHLLENGFSLLFGACYFSDERFYRKAAEILREELTEQILFDGGHFERSPMYHQIMLGRTLDCLNLLQFVIANELTQSHKPWISKEIATAHWRLLRKFPSPGGRELRGGGVNRFSTLSQPSPVKGEGEVSYIDNTVAVHQGQLLAMSGGEVFKGLTKLLVEKSSVMLGWLEQITFRNGAIPLMNDAAFGIAPKTAELSAYAARLGIHPRTVALGGSGYRKIGNERYEVILDVGDIGPNYLPGHAHADTFSFELYVSDCPVIIDSGTSTYEDCSLRHWQRSTRAHNTVEIDGQDQSEVWGGFRVARRARITALKEGEGFIKAAHDGYQRLPGKPMHLREWRFGERSFQISDRIIGRFREAVGRFHFHPDVRLDAHSEACQTGTGHLNNGTLFSWHIRKGRGHVTETTYHPEFNVSIPNRCLEVFFVEPETIVEFTLENFVGEKH